MSSNRNRTILLAIAVVAVVAGLVIAIAGGGKGHSHVHLNRDHVRGVAGSGGGTAGGSAAEGDTEAGGSSSSQTSSARTTSRTVLAAQYLGVSRKQLRTRLRKGKSLGQIANSIQGKSREGLIAALLAGEEARLNQRKLPASVTKTRLDHYRERITAEVDRVRGSAQVERDLLAASTYLGITDAFLHQRLESGETLTDIAGATAGRSAAGLKAAIVESRTKQLETYEHAKLITEQAAQSSIAALGKQVESELQRKLLQTGAAGSPSN